LGKYAIRRGGSIRPLNKGVLLDKQRGAERWTGGRGEKGRRERAKLFKVRKNKKKIPRGQRKKGDAESLKQDPIRKKKIASSLMGKVKSPTKDR